MNPNVPELPLALIKSYFEIALAEANVAGQSGEVPVGAIVVKNGIIIGRGHNQKEYFSDPIQHAEIIAIQDACKSTGNWRLDDCILVSTLEPCPMCAGAILHARIAKVYFGAFDLKWGAAGTKTDLFSTVFFNHRTIATHIEYDECAQILTNFFKQLRQN
ncbi:nucleoside deaminase [bacterium]|nr:nucleoside deaminase [bacterium]